jgi:hypothetical protein
MASFLAKIAGNRALLASMSVAARVHVRERFTMRVLGSVMNSLYQQAAALPAPPAPRTIAD